MKNKDLVVKFLTASLKKDNVEKMNRMEKQLATGKGVSNDHNKA